MSDSDPSPQPITDAAAFDFYPERWLSGVAIFSDAEQLSYLRLLCHQWLNDGLPDDLATLKRLGGKGVNKNLLTKFPAGPDGKRRNARLEKIRSDQRERIASRRLGGALTNAQRYGLDSLSESDKALVLASSKGRKLFADTVASEPEVTSLATRHHPPPTTHPENTLSPAHTPKRRDPAHASEADYPTLETVQAWAQGVMAPVECANRWHAEQAASCWCNRHGHPLTTDPGALRSLFATYATSWKANDSRTASRERSQGRSSGEASHGERESTTW